MARSTFSHLLDDVISTMAFMEGSHRVLLRFAVPVCIEPLQLTLSTVRAKRSSMGSSVSSTRISQSLLSSKSSLQ